MIVINLLSEKLKIKNLMGSRYFISLPLEVNVKSMNVKIFIEEFI
jgi:hypothetical protein